MTSVTAPGAPRPLLRRASVAGLMFGSSFVMHHLLQGIGPRDSTAAQVAAYDIAHRGALLASEVVLGLGLLAFLVFLAPLVGHLRQVGQETLSVALQVAGTVFLTLSFMSTAAETALVGVAGSGEPGAVEALNQLQGRIPVVWAVTAVVTAVSLAARATDVLPRWLGTAGLVLAATFLLASVSSLVGRGVEGGYSLIGVAPFSVWVFTVAGCLWRASRIELAAPERTTTAADRGSAGRR